MLTRAFSRRAGTLVALTSLAAASLAGCSGNSSLPGTASLPAAGAAVGANALSARGPLAAAHTAQLVRKNMQAESVLINFGTPDTYGKDAFSNLTYSNGTLWGTTISGIASESNGVVYGVTNGSEIVLHLFAGGADGSSPRGGLAVIGGTFYGTTQLGGSANDGTIYKINRLGRKTVLHNFTGADGANPGVTLTYAGGMLYGTTEAGGIYAGCGSGGCGVVFEISPTGTGFKVLHSFNGNDGATLYAPLTDVSGMLYGTTGGGGGNGDGDIFEISTSGSGFKVLYSFADGADGASPYGGLTSVKGMLYGTTYRGGSNNDGTVYEITPSGTGYKQLYSFAGGSDGANPQCELTVLNGALFGTTPYGGSYNAGTVFEVLPGFNGSEIVVYAFDGPAGDGAAPAAGLTAVNGILYGTTTGGGSDGDGSVYQLTL